ncbi:MAG: CHAT domain-containing protein, partial [Candidatus Krumholzibacteria bacterium]|nr:CHAT domain-containing protein [Candidatus Krumholzibacteria bacterium]
AESGELSEFSVIHIATHALIDDRLPEQSALVLSLCDLPDQLTAAINGERIYDGMITAGEVMREWRLNADLVALSACESGLGMRIAGEGYIGFSNAFLQAGARSLVVSLWQVQDRATSMLMQRFYENCYGRGGSDGPGSNKPMDKAQALREAKIWLMNYVEEDGSRPFAHPYFWSAFVLMGDRGYLRD